MCGIVGILNLSDKPPPEMTALLQMLAMIRHRGPDGFGIYRDDEVGMGSARLSIIDLSGGDQPIGNEAGTSWIVFNGEIFNYVELREQLLLRGHRFSTRTDTEVVLHLYEDYGAACLGLLNGQFAIAIWNARSRSLFLARDRLGIRPLFYTVRDGQLIFGSEIKALLAHPRVRGQIDRSVLEQIFTYWSTLAPQTIFQGIYDIPPGHYLLAQDRQFTIKSYWAMDFVVPPNGSRSTRDYMEELESLLIDASRIRLRADVPVGAYLSGGLDSSITTAIIRKHTQASLDTFSIAFADNPEFDESEFQLRMARFLETNHQVVHCTHADIARVFPDVIWHTETPVLRTSPAPMFLLSRLVHDHSLKVVVTGEGADEFLAGYDIFKEMQVRRFWARRSESRLRPLLLKRLYSDIAGLSNGSDAYRQAFFKTGLAETHSPYYSHMLRWSNTSRIQRFLLPRSGAAATPPPLPPDFAGWSHLAQAQYLEISVFLSQYLLSSQGDRVAMAHSVEGRFPFLDYRVVEFCNRLPPDLKLKGLTEKWLLRQIGRKYLPEDIWRRPKRPYRAPIHRSFFEPVMPDYVLELLSESSLRESGLFDPTSVTLLVRKAAGGARLGEVEDMAIAGILSTQLVHRQFVRNLRSRGLNTSDRIKVVDHTKPPLPGVYC